MSNNKMSMMMGHVLCKRAHASTQTLTERKNKENQQDERPDRQTDRQEYRNTLTGKHSPKKTVQKKQKERELKK